MKHPLDIYLHANPYIGFVGDNPHPQLTRGWDYDDRIPVSVRDVPGSPVLGRARLRPRMNRGRIVYRLPWRLWPWRHLSASGEWRGTPEGRLVLMSILLIPELGVR